jgi:hypothetical protein
MYLCAKVINFASFYDFTVRFWNCSGSVVFFGTVPTVWYFLELFRQCGIFWNCSDSVVFACLLVWLLLFVLYFIVCILWIPIKELKHALTIWHPARISWTILIKSCLHCNKVRIYSCIEIDLFETINWSCWNKKLQENIKPMLMLTTELS